MNNIYEFLEFVDVIYPDQETVDQTVKIRKETGMKLPDAPICAQSKQLSYTLFTNDRQILNTDIDLKSFNPFQ